MNERNWKSRESTNRRKEGRRSRWLRKETCGNWGEKEAIGKLRAECQICEGSGRHWGFGWDVSQLFFFFLPKYHTNKGNQRNLKRHEGRKRTGKSETYC